MKLKTKIVLVVGIVLLFTIIVSDVAVYKVSRDLMYNEALQAAYVESADVFSGIADFSSEISGVFSKSLIKFYLSSEGDDYTVCLNGAEVYYNRTVLSAEELSSGEYKKYEDLNYKEYVAAGNNILIFKFTRRNTDFFRIINITRVYDRLHALLSFMAVLSLCLTVISSAALWLLIKKTLTPLSRLSEGARKIAEGAYGQRVVITSTDEVGKLGKDFNSMAEAIEKHTRDLEEAEYKKTLFMADLTHELKTPLTAISGYAQLLRSVELKDEDKTEALTYIYEESKRLDRLSKKMMRLLELEESSFIDLCETNTSEIVTSAINTCRAFSDEKGVELRADVNNNKLKCDLDLMRELLINLIDNGVKACSRGGKVTVTADSTGITVTDNGCGMDEGELERITEPFYMVDRSRSRKIGGAGLGLALVKQIAELHGMNIVFESSLGVGTSVKIVF